MKITKRQLRKIIREERSAISGEREISPEQAEAYLRSKSDAYRRQGVTGKSMEMLLMDDFMDDLGHQHNAEDYEGYIRELVLGESNMRLTKRQLIRIIKEEKARLLSEESSAAPEVATEIKRIIQTLRDTQAAMRAVTEKVKQNKFDFNHILPQAEKDILKYASGLEPAAERLELLLTWSELDD